jgi:hypothetical protein
MKGKASAKADSGRTKKKEKAGKIKKTSVSPEKSAAKKTETGSVRPDAAKGEKKVKASTGTKAKTKTKAEVEVKVKTEKRPARLVGKKKEQPPKKAKKAVGEKKQVKKTDRKPSKLRKTPPKPANKSKRPRKVTDKIKQAKQASEKKEKIGTKVTSQKRKTGTTKISGGAAIKTGTGKISASLSKDKLKRQKTEKGAKTVRARRTPDLASEKPAGVEGKEKRPPLSEWKIFPEEYGENYIELMTVDPHKLFVFWEVREDAREAYSGDLNIRIHDMTGIDTDSLSANYFDVKVDKRIGKRYIVVSPAGQFSAEIGIIYDGIFLALAKSMKVSTPRAGVPEQGAWPQEIYEAISRTGY